MTSYPPSSLPTPEEEIWRYSRIDQLDANAYTPTAIDAAVTGWTPAAAAGVDGVEPPADVFAELNASLATPVVLRIPPGHAAADPIEVVWRAPADGTAVFPRLVVETGPDAEITIVERFASDDVSALVVPVTELRAGPGARVRYLATNQLGPRVWQIAHQMGRAEQDSSTLLATVALGGYYARVRTDARLDGKGAVQDHARSVYTGLIRVRKSAAGTNAFQTNRNLKLSEGAWADSVPNLEIENNDVRCSHASAVGPIDPDQRFYLESRGVRPATAERLIVLGFFDEVLERLPAPHVVPELRRAIAAKLDRRTA
jgi:Fe-S cluster assembly protein SufD